MYNGIGLPTPRGSGTNGYVQRNLSAVRHKKERTDYKSEEELRKLESSLVKKPNQEILDHERKRKVELKCLELAELMEEQGYAEGEIQEKVATFRLMLLEKDVALGKEGEQQPEQKPAVTETHQLAEANEKKNERLRAAFGISENYVDGSSFDPNRRAKEAAAAAAKQQEQQKQYSLVRESSSSRSPSPKQKKKKKKKDRGRSETCAQITPRAELLETHPVLKMRESPIL
ncbi:serine/arginine repetitive matrix protein 2 [Pangshura tecta]